MDTHQKLQPSKSPQKNCSILCPRRLNAMAIKGGRNRREGARWGRKTLVGVGGGVVVCAVGVDAGEGVSGKWVITKMNGHMAHAYV